MFRRAICSTKLVTEGRKTQKSYIFVILDIDTSVQNLKISDELIRFTFYMQYSTNILMAHVICFQRMDF